jgi:uncharacterized protein involved in response to NO
MKLAAHPLWLVGFRPFFALAFLSGLALPVLWASVYAGGLPALASPVSAVQWHAHEMFYGFGWAVLGSFLLTATKNWVKIRGVHGAPLIFLVAAWLFERAGMAFGAHWPMALVQVSSYLFLVAIIAVILWTLIRYQRQDFYFPDNLFFVVALPFFIPAKTLLLNPAHFALGWSMTIGLFRLAFLLMLERTLIEFMQGAFKVSILRNRALDTIIKLLALAMVFEGLIPTPVSGIIAVILAALLIIRFAFWHPQLGLRRLDIGIMYLGYLMIVAQLLLALVERIAQPTWIGAVSVHVFTFGVIGFIMPAMLIRISKGHTGRKVMFDAIDRLVLWIMIAAFVFRLVAPQIYPAGYARWIDLSAACWFLAFATLAWRYIPFLVRPRADGREH